MKTCSVIVVALLMISCGKGTVQPPPPVLHLVCVNSQGNNLIASADTTIVTYSENGLTKTLPLLFEKIRKSASDTTTSAKYGGLCLQLSAMLSRNKTYSLYINNISYGAFYFTDDDDPTKNLFFNSKTVMTDTSVMPFVSVFQVTK